MSQLLTHIISRVTEFHYNRPTNREYLQFMDSIYGLILLMARNRRNGEQLIETEVLPEPPRNSNIYLTDFMFKLIQLYRNAPNMTSQEVLSETAGIHTALIKLITNKPQLIPQFEVKKVDAKCPVECMICQEVPNYSDAIQTDCGHYHCKECWKQWAITAAGRPTCTACRKPNPLITGFKIEKNVSDDDKIEWDE